MTDHTGAGNIVGSARKAQAERDHDCERQGHQWSEVRTLDSVIPVGFVCLKCPVHLTTVEQKPLPPLYVEAYEAFDAHPGSWQKDGRHWFREGYVAHAMKPSPSPAPNPSETREAR